MNGVSTVSRGRRVWVSSMVLLFGLGVGLLLTEIVARFAFPPPARHYVWPPNVTMEFRPDVAVLSGASPRSRYVVNSWGVRGGPIQPGPGPRVLFVGGSAVECIYLDQGRSFPALVEDRLNAGGTGPRAWVGNVGKSGLNSRDHVRQLRDLLVDLPRIDTVVVLTGVNDVGAALRVADPVEVARPVPDATLLARVYYAYPEGPARSRFYERTGLWQVARRARLVEQKLFPPANVRENETGEVIARWRSHRAAAHRYRDALPDLGPALAAQRADLDEMVDLARERGVRIVLVTQPTLWRADLPPSLSRLLWMGGIGTYMEEPGHEYYAAGALARAMSAFNFTLMDVARERGVEGLDLAEMLPRDGTVFFDDCHFTQAGSARVADLLAAYLAATAPTRRGPEAPRDVASR